MKEKIIQFFLETDSSLATGLRIFDVNFLNKLNIEEYYDEDDNSFENLIIYYYNNYDDMDLERI